MPPMTLINPFEVSPESEHGFLDNWRRATEFLRHQDGYISSRLERSNSHAGRFRYVNVTVWRSRYQFLKAISRPEFQKILDELQLPHYRDLYDLFLAPSFAVPPRASSRPRPANASSSSTVA